MVCRWLPDGTISFVNQPFCQYLGKKPEQLVGRSFMALIPEKDQRGVKESVASLRPDHPAATVEHRVVGKDGQIRWPLRGWPLQVRF